MRPIIKQLLIFSNMLHYTTTYFNNYIINCMYLLSYQILLYKPHSLLLRCPYYILNIRTICVCWTSHAHPIPRQRARHHHTTTPRGGRATTCDTTILITTNSSTNIQPTNHESRVPRAPHQKHFLWTMVGPLSSNSALLIHICWKVDKEANIEPPIHTENRLSAVAMTFTRIADGASLLISAFIRSARPQNIVVPPDSTMFWYKSLRISTSQRMMDSYVMRWIPSGSRPYSLGLKRTSGARKRSLPMVIT